jgi:hypothetical protein
MQGSSKRVTHDDAMVAASDIARLAAVGRAAVSNWRRRYEDFPRPAGGTASSPLFRLAEVETWLERYGKTLNVGLGDRIWQRLRATNDDLRLGAVVGFVGAFLVHLQRDPSAHRTPAAGGRLVESVTKTVPEFPGALPRDVDQALISDVATFADQKGPVAAFDFFCDRYAEAHGRRLLLTPPDIADLMIRLAGGGEGSLLDPACGLGTLLVRATPAELLLGQELADAQAQITTARLLLRGRPVEISIGDSLRADAFPGREVDAAVCNPPFSERVWGYEELAGDPRWEYGLPPRGEPELAWVQHCLAHVRPGGRVAIMMPAAATARRAGRRIRANLLRAGALLAVVTVTAGAGASSQTPDLWVLRRPLPDERTPYHVLMIDASGDLSLADRAWEAYLHDPDAARDLPEGAKAVRVLDLLDEDVDISPSRQLDRPVARGPAFADLRRQALNVIGTAATALPELSPSARSTSTPMTTVGELIKLGMVVLHQASIKSDAGGGSTPMLTAKDVRVGRPPSGTSTPDAGTVITEPGDIVVPVQVADTTARVLEEGGAVLGPQLYLFRVDPERVDPHFLAGFIRAAGRAGTARTSSVSNRIDPRRAPIPRIPLADQQRYGEAFARLGALEDTLREVQTLGEELVRLGFDGLTDGSLTP